MMNSMMSLGLYIVLKMFDSGCSGQTQGQGPVSFQESLFVGYLMLRATYHHYIILVLI